MQRFLWATWLIASVLSLPYPAAAQTDPAPTAAATPTPAASSSAIPPLIPVAHFAGESLVREASLSPDGTRFVLRFPLAGRTRIGVFDAATKQMVFAGTASEHGEVLWARWAGSRRLLISISGTTTMFGLPWPVRQIQALDLDTGTFRFVGLPTQGIDGDNLVHVDPEGAFVLLAAQRNVFAYPSIWKISLDPQSRTAPQMIQGPRPGVWQWIADNAGVVRMGIGWHNSRLRIHYRARPEDDLRVIARLDNDDVREGLAEIANVASGTDEGLAMVRDVDGRIVLRRFNFATRTFGELVHADPEWDIHSVITGSDRALLGVTVIDENERVVWFDPALRRTQQRLEQALPGSRVVIVSRAADNSRMLVWAGSENDPGALYIYTPRAQTLDIFTAVRPDLDPAQLARPTTVTIAARDGTEMRAYLALPVGREAKGLPLIVLPHGGPYGVRDVLEYSDEVQFLANRGYAVLQPNYRGSGGYGEFYDELGRGQIGRAMQDDLDDAMDWAVAQGFVDPGRVCMVGSSYGGYAALWAAIRNPERYRCVVSFAGVTDWDKQLQYNSRFLDRKDSRQFRDRIEGEAPEFDLDSVSPALHAARLTRPVLLAHGQHDSVVPFRQFTLMREAAQRARVPIETLVFPEAGHGFNRTEDRIKWFEALEAFLTRHNPP